MRLIADIVALQRELVSWRHDLHAHPETSFEEHRTSEVVAELRRFHQDNRLEGASLKSMIEEGRR